MPDPAPTIDPRTLEWLTPLRWTRVWGWRAVPAQAGLRGTDWAGVAWRSRLGPALLAVSPPAFGALYGDDAPAGRWSLSVRRLPGQDLEGVELRLFGLLALHRPAVQQALERLCDAPADKLGGGHTPGWIEEDAGALLQAPTCSAGAFTLASLTPLALARPQGLGDAVPDTALLWRRLLSRLQQLQAPHARTLPPGMRAWTDWVDRQAALASAWQPVRERRYSARQARMMPLSGWRGFITWGPESAALQPWWRLAEAVQLGAKTRFGMGTVRLRAAG